MKVFRQGDVLVRQVRTRSPLGHDLREDGRIVLAHGEVTGHAHEVVPADDVITETAAPAAQFFQEPSGRRFLFVERACVLTHQEHGPIALAPGCYEITRQREYVAPDLNRSVAD